MLLLQEPRAQSPDCKKKDKIPRDKLAINKIQLAQSNEATQPKRKSNTSEVKLITGSTRLSNDRKNLSNWMGKPPLLVCTSQQNEKSNPAGQ
jgi:hypothetical protein